MVTGVDLGLLVSFTMVISGAALLMSGFRCTESDAAADGDKPDEAVDHGTARTPKIGRRPRRVSPAAPIRRAALATATGSEVERAAVYSRFCPPPSSSSSL
jgi:hypothetical protein